MIRDRIRRVARSLFDLDPAERPEPASRDSLRRARILISLEQAFGIPFDRALLRGLATPVKENVRTESPSQL